MDILSHILIGKIISFNRNFKTQCWTMLFSYLPDLTQLPYYLILGHDNFRPFFFPKIADWFLSKNNYVFLTALYQVSHSLLFAVLIILPIVLYFKLPKIAIFAYILHIFIDIPTHTGIWKIQPFYPFSYAINGFTDAWAWPFMSMFYSWIILILIIYALEVWKKKYRVKA